MKVLVCGGRDFRDAEFVQHTLSALEVHPTLIIHGFCRGADLMARDWAQGRGIDHIGYQADWAKHGRAAGPIRNRLMLERERPDLVVAFRGGAGTRNMVKLAREAGVAVILPRST